MAHESPPNYRHSKHVKRSITYINKSKLLSMYTFKWVTCLDRSHHYPCKHSRGQYIKTGITINHVHIQGSTIIHMHIQGGDTYIKSLLSMVNWN